MRPLTIVSAAALVLCGAGVCSAQPEAAPLSLSEIAVACAPPPVLARPPDHALRVVGAQDTVRRGLFGPRDLLVIGGGTRAGVLLDQQFFVRRAVRFGARYGAQTGMRYGTRYASGRSTAPPEAIITDGWVRIVAVNDTTAIATVEHACGPLFLDDYLEPFVAPSLPAAVERVETPGEPDFTLLGHVVSGMENRRVAGTGELVVVDRGSDQGVVPGARFAIYRDVGADGLPLMSVGEAVILSTGKERSLARIVSARDGVQSGDYVAPRK
jgi:hypothetical protein